MKTTSFLFLALLSAGILALGASRAAAYEYGDPAWGLSKESSFFRAGDGSFYDTWLRGRLSIGLKYSSATLTKADRPADPTNTKTFIGNVNQLEEENPYYAPVVEYALCDYVRLEVSYYKVSARTRNFNHNQTSDGIVTMSGPYLGLKLQVPLWERRIFPYFSIGEALLHGDFDEDDWWYYGWSMPEDWETAGKPTGMRGGHTREIHVEDCNTFIWGFGLAVRPIPNLELEAFYTSGDPSADNEFGYGYANKPFDKHKDGDFTLDNHMWGFCAKFVF